MLQFVFMGGLWLCGYILGGICVYIAMSHRITRLEAPANPAATPAPPATPDTPAAPLSPAVAENPAPVFQEFPRLPELSRGWLGFLSRSDVLPVSREVEANAPHGYANTPGTRSIT